MPLTRDSQIAALALVTAGVAVLVGGVPHLTSTAPLAGLLLAIAAAVGEWREIVIGRVNFSLTAPLVVLGAAIGGPVTAVIVALGACSVEFIRPNALRKGNRRRIATTIGLSVTEAIVAGFAATLVSVGDFYLKRVVVASLAYFLANVGGVLLVLRARGAVRLRSDGPKIARVAAVTLIVAIPVSCGLAYAYHQLGVIALLGTFVPLAAGVAWHELYRDRERLIQRGRADTMSFAFALVQALDARDAYTAAHSAAVAVYAHDIALEIGYQQEQAANVRLAGLLHDIGKIGIPTDVLHKPARLDQAEYEVLQGHPAIGEKIVSEAHAFGPILTMIRSHHERPDGKGYPDRLRGEEIPEAAAIIGIADAYNAMTSVRPYRAAMEPEAAIRELWKGNGTQFNERLVEIFVRILWGKDEAYRRGQDPSFTIDQQRRALLADLEANVLLQQAA